MQISNINNLCLDNFKHTLSNIECKLFGLVFYPVRGMLINKNEIKVNIKIAVKHTNLSINTCMLNNISLTKGSTPLQI